MSIQKARAKVRYAVVGAGNIAQVAVLPAFAHASENSELVAIISSDDEKQRVLGERYGVKHTGTYEDMEQVLADSRADAVYIALPNDLHRFATERAFKAGVHVLCEKPMAMTEDDCRAMNDAAAAFDRKLMVAYRLHFEEANLKAIDLVRTGKIGIPRFLTATLSHLVKRGDIRTRADMGGGALYDVGVYPINAARNIFGAEPTEVFAYSVGQVDNAQNQVDEISQALLRFPNGCLAQLTASQGAGDVSTYRVVGTEGDLRVEPAFEYASELAHALTVNGKTRATKFPKRDQFAPELVYFSRCILEDLEPEPSGEEGLADVRVLEALKRSAAEGRPILLPEMTRKMRPDLSLEMHKPPVRKPKTVNAPSPSL
ncbi:MAG: Gfo/Idh/MocA family oxidoreductase [Myxococcaceae bacterium]|nr:Gfo/Idh/MocA family oxidoreductase [Myxococcaceae bacterium]